MATTKKKKKAGRTTPASRAQKKASPRAKAGTARKSGRNAGPHKKRFAREKANDRRHRAEEILDRLDREYPGATTALDHDDPFQLLVATILSAQCTDERVNQVTPALFARYPAARELADARVEDVEDMIRSTGFFRNKTRSLLGMANAVVERFGGSIPASMEDLVTLPGVGRKTANVVLGTAFRMNEGVVVDTHVSRLSQRMGLTKQKDPVRIETDLMKLFARERWTDLAHTLILHGRAVCRAPTPRCERCVVTDLCPSSRV